MYSLIIQEMVQLLKPVRPPLAGVLSYLGTSSGCLLAVPCCWSSWEKALKHSPLQWEHWAGKTLSLGTHRRPEKYVHMKCKARVFSNLVPQMIWFWFCFCFFSSGSMCSFSKCFIEGKLLPIQYLYSYLWHYATLQVPPLAFIFPFFVYKTFSLFFFLM